MGKLKSKTRRSLVMAGTAGIAALATPQAWQTKLARSVVQPTHAQNTTTWPRTTHRQEVAQAGQHVIPSVKPRQFSSSVEIPLEIRNKYRKDSDIIPRIVNVRLKLDIEHSFFSALWITLTSPDGHRVELWGEFTDGGIMGPRSELAQARPDLPLHHLYYHGLGAYTYTDTEGNHWNWRDGGYWSEHNRQPCAFGAHLTLDDYTYRRQLTAEHCRTHEWIGGPGEAGHFNTGGRLLSFWDRSPHHGIWKLKIHDLYGISLNTDGRRGGRKLLPHQWADPGNKGGWLHRAELTVWSEGPL